MSSRTLNDGNGLSSHLGFAQHVRSLVQAAREQGQLSPVTAQNQTQIIDEDALSIGTDSGYSSSVAPEFEINWVSGRCRRSESDPLRLRRRSDGDDGADEAISILTGE